MTLGFFKRIISLFFYRMGLTPRLAWFQDLPKKHRMETFHILIYHRINDFNDPFTIDSLAVSDFENQMRYLSRHYHVLPLEEIFNYTKNRRNLPNRCIAITFDDGYEDNYLYAYKILRKYNLPATVFLTVDGVNSQNYLWFDQVLSAFKETRRKRFICPFNESNFDIRSIEEKRRTAHVMLEKLKKADNEKRKEFIGKIREELRISSTAEYNNHSKLLTWPQIKEMANDHITFGSHTMTHPILSTLPTSKMDWELNTSRQIIEREIDSEVLFLSYPNGKKSDYNRNVIHSLKEAGYKAALTTAPHINNSSTDPYRWGRYRPWPNQVEHFAMALFMHGFMDS